MRAAPWLALVVGASLLAACRSTTGAPVARGPTSVVPSTSPTAAYSALARQIKTCWFNPADPVLSKHTFHAAAPVDAPARIAIHELAADGRRGLKAFTIGFEPRGAGTAISTDNLRLPYALGQRLSADVGRWLRGDGRCEGDAGAATPRGSISGPRGSY